MTTEENLRAAHLRWSRRLTELGNEARQLRVNWDRSEILNAPTMTWTPHLSALLCGIHDETCILNVMKGQESSLLAHIYGYAFSFVWENWKEMIAPEYKRFVHNTLPAPFLRQAHTVSTNMADKLRETCDDPIRTFTHRFGRVAVPGHAEVTAQGFNLTCAFSRCGNVSFPQPSGVDVNMLPFIMGDKNSLPGLLQKYYDPLVAKCPMREEEMGKICYLSITERYIAKGDTQRRGGLHIEAPMHPSRFAPGDTIRARWGGGNMGRDRFDGGIYIASTVSDTCAIYDALIDQETTDSHGGMEHLRPLLNRPYLIPANELIWMTDRTPHQAMPQPKEGYRQFFRLVTSGINVWHSQHCTANPKVPLPDHVLVLDYDRFSEGDRYDEDGRKPAASG